MIPLRSPVHVRMWIHILLFSIDVIWQSDLKPERLRKQLTGSSYNRVTQSHKQDMLTDWHIQLMLMVESGEKHADNKNSFPGSHHSTENFHFSFKDYEMFQLNLIAQVIQSFTFPSIRKE